MIRVTYNIKGAPPLVREGKFDVIPVNASGKASTSNPMFDYGTVIDKYYYVDEKGKRTTIDPSCVSVRGNGGYSNSEGVVTHYTKIEVTHSACGEEFRVNGSGMM